MGTGGEADSILIHIRASAYTHTHTHTHTPVFSLRFLLGTGLSWGMGGDSTLSGMLWSLYWSQTFKLQN